MWMARTAILTSRRATLRHILRRIVVAAASMYGAVFVLHSGGGPPRDCRVRYPAGAAMLPSAVELPHNVPIAAGDRAMTERGLVFEDFADKVNEVFVISQDGLPAIPLTLKEA